VEVVATLPLIRADRALHCGDDVAWQQTIVISTHSYVSLSNRPLLSQHLAIRPLATDHCYLNTLPSVA
jgi:hypothetical protein